jgi:hypothetical protein
MPASLQQGRRINLILRMTGDGTTTPVVTALVLRYRPVPFMQRVWGFTIRAGTNMRFLDESPEHRAPETIIEDLFALLNAGQVDFSTILEPTTRKVYVTDVQMAPPLIGRSEAQLPISKEESFVSVEILEAAAQDDNAEVTPPQQDPEELPLEDPDRGPGDDLPQQGPGAGPPAEDPDRVPDPFSQP